MDEDQTVPQRHHIAASPQVEGVGQLRTFGNRHIAVDNNSEILSGIRVHTITSRDGHRIVSKPTFGRNTGKQARGAIENQALGQNPRAGVGGDRITSGSHLERVENTFEESGSHWAGDGRRDSTHLHHHRRTGTFIVVRGGCNHRKLVFTKRQHRAGGWGVSQQAW